MNQIAKTNERAVEYTPLAEQHPLKLTMGMVRNVIAVPTRSGQVPDDRKLIEFMVLCRARALNPLTGDAFLIGYDSKRGPSFSIVVSAQAMRKRAEVNPNFDGCRVGLIVLEGDQVNEIHSNAYFGSGEVVGAWAECQRKDHAVPYTAHIKREAYDPGSGYWAKNPELMLCKVAEVAALRRAFPSDLGGCYMREEFGSDGEKIAEREPEAPQLDKLTTLEQTGIVERPERIDTADAPEVKTAAPPVEPQKFDADGLPANTDDGAPSIEDMEREGLVTKGGELFPTNPEGVGQ